MHLAWLVLLKHSEVSDSTSCVAENIWGKIGTTAIIWMIRAPSCRWLLHTAGFGGSLRANTTYCSMTLSSYMLVTFLSSNPAFSPVPHGQRWHLTGAGGGRGAPESSHQRFDNLFLAALRLPREDRYCLVWCLSSSTFVDVLSKPCSRVGHEKRWRQAGEMPKAPTNIAAGSLFPTVLRLPTGRRRSIKAWQAFTLPRQILIIIVLIHEMNKKTNRPNMQHEMNTFNLCAPGVSTIAPIKSSKTST